ncbi:MAG: LPS export ABC transporter periplasmic protein LptC [Gammaproteobacteria bacterium]|uniref:LPS export ABC transporter periplasmic protein LptC n=1 Tax=Rhodoferax sp. TaxID=50421 RepID=UPI001853258E|nr:LPS export ABC transporter periplasmic protein LptC [Rhodoferax sp.]MBU3897922.1 LPS export ABC transporter periplasmic protein LptC [Gammaproteobacteria bacterium]MBA3058890.1 LPS export ABC transporter periplasmic protein LptC [Rhodoferax sp.]MBU3998629.1 LPS export ABC transporter periplasmic protein LptC [Gammaproteobacteria bacterium]MBU4081383.1 LPS export ABC transporter periplasmic protein LptC [Gammaproteobacteria bacterium]MBU4114583.1 LPS export ABC transporter periplasmic protei
MINLLRVLGDRMTLYLPIILMGLLALGTYWLVRSTPLLMLQGKEAQVRHEPDYFMRNFSVKSFDVAGRLKTEVFGADARHFPDSDMLEIDLVRIRSFDETGGLTTATARRAVTNADATEVQLFGEARVVREPPAHKTAQAQPRMEFRSEFLHAFMDTERFVSDRPVELLRGNDRFTADSMEFDNIKRVMDLKGRVKGALMPPAAK